MNHVIRNSFIAIYLLSSSPLMAASENFVLDPTHTNVVWSANHFGFSNVSGKFAKVDGQLTLDEANPENSKVKVTIVTASVITGIEKFDAHLKSDAFFDVEKFPNATFESTKVDVTEAGKKAKVTGNLTLHGVTKPVVLDVILNKIDLNPISNKKTAGFSATTVIKRSEFAINYALPGVADDVMLTINSEAAVQ